MAGEFADFLLVIGYALLPALGNLAGAALAETLRSPEWVVGAALHGAAGIAIALVSVDLMPRILDHVPMWVIVLCFLAGAAFSLLLWFGIRLLRRPGGGARSGALMVYVAIAADLLSDGMVTGAGSAVSSGLGVMIAATQLVANVPGGFAATTNLRESVPARRRWLLNLGLFLPVVASASAGFWLLRDQSALIKNAALALVAGVLLLAIIEDMLPEGDRPRPPRWISTLCFAFGFAGLSLATAYLG